MHEIRRFVPHPFAEGDFAPGVDGRVPGAGGKASPKKRNTSKLIADLDGGPSDLSIAGRLEQVFRS